MLDVKRQLGGGLVGRPHEATYRGIRPRRALPKRADLRSGYERDESGDARCIPKPGDSPDIRIGRVTRKVSQDGVPRHGGTELNCEPYEGKRPPAILAILASSSLNGRRCFGHLRRTGIPADQAVPATLGAMSGQSCHSAARRGRGGLDKG